MWLIEHNQEVRNEVHHPISLLKLTDSIFEDFMRVKMESSF
jgi:hypothetical protein